MKQTKPHPLRRRGAKRTGKQATPPPRLDRWTYPRFLDHVKAAMSANNKVAHLQKLCKPKHTLSRDQARRCLANYGWAPTGELREAKAAYLMHTAIMHAKATPRAYWMRTEELKQLTRRVNAKEAHMTMAKLWTSDVIPGERTVQRMFTKMRVYENKVIVRNRIRLKNRETDMNAKRKLSKKEIKAMTIMKEKHK